MRELVHQPPRLEDPERLGLRLVALELAVEWSGLDAVEGGVVSSRRAAKMAVFWENVSPRQREKAVVMKQESLFQQGREKRAKVDGGGGGVAASSSSKVEEAAASVAVAPMEAPLWMASAEVPPSASRRAGP